MVQKNRKKDEIEPLYVKNDKGKIVSVFFNIEDYEAILRRIKEFEKIKAKEKKLKTKTKK